MMDAIAVRIISLPIDGMTCASCVRRALNGPELGDCDARHPDPPPLRALVTRRLVHMVALSIGAAAAGLFATGAYLLGPYDTVAVSAGAAWVLLLTTIVAIPVLTERVTRNVATAWDQTDPEREA